MSRSIRLVVFTAALLSACTGQEGTVIIELDPVPLPAALDGGHAMQTTPLLNTRIPDAGWLTRFAVELVDEDGEILPQSMLHHVNLMLPERRELFRPIMQRLAAAGEETRPIEVPWPLGVRTDADEELLAFAMLHNPTAIDHGDVTVRLILSYTRAPRLTVQPLFIDASPPPGSAAWDLPPGRSTRSWEGPAVVDGRILGLGGHLHRYGTELVLEDVTTGRVIYRERPELDAHGNIAHVPRRTYLRRFGHPVRTGHVYRITVVYDNPTGDTIHDGGMAAIGGVIRPRRGAWAAADRADPLYVEDLNGFNHVNGHGRYDAPDGAAGHHSGGHVH